MIALVGPIELSLSGIVFLLDVRLDKTVSFLDSSLVQPVVDVENLLAEFLRTRSALLKQP